MKRPLSLVLVFSLVLATALSAAPASAPKGAVSVPVGGTFTDALGGTGVFSGTFAIARFEARGNQLLANGYLSGTLTDSAGKPLGTVMKSVSWPVDLSSSGAAALAGERRVSTQATCDVLNLVLGPLHLDLLGLTVDLNQVVLDIAAQTGSGNLLGNLLCAVVSLLDGAGALVDIANLLNQILDVLSDILS